MAEIPTSIMRKIELFLVALNQHKRIQRAFVYGSFATGTATEWSDIDVAIVSSDFSEDLFEERLNLMRIAFRIDERIEPHPFTPDAFDGDDPLASEVRQNGVLVRELETQGEGA